MSKKTVKGINLTCVFQNTNNFGTTNASNNNVAIPGMLSDLGKGEALFEETIPRKRVIRNNRLYEGEYLNVVRRKDGLYYPFLKAFNPETAKDKSAYVLKVCNELSEMFNKIF